MKVAIKDKETLKSVRPFDIAAYLRTSGWTRTGEIDGHLTFWTQGNLNLSIPVNQLFADYAQRIYEALSILEQRENRSQLQIVRDIATTSADIIRLRDRSPSSAEGSIPIDEGIRLHESAREMMLSSASSVILPREYYKGRRPADATEYLKNVKFGQTEIGSYILTILSPVPPRLSDRETLFDDDVPYERKVTTQLHRALERTKTAALDAASTGEFDSFIEAVKSGVSGNLCNAIANLSEEISEGAGLEVSFTWSRTRPEISNAYRSITLTPDSVPVIREAARKLKERAPEEDFLAVGVIIHIDRPEQERQGLVKLLALTAEGTKTINIELSGDDWTRAHAAINNKLPVRCTGDLHKEGRSFVLKNPGPLNYEENENNTNSQTGIDC